MVAQINITQMTIGRPIFRPLFFIISLYTLLENNSKLAVLLVLKLFFSLLFLSVLFATHVHAHAQDEFIILDIEQGELQLESSKIDQEYLAALKRKRLRQLSAMNWQDKFQFYLSSGFKHIIPKGLDHIIFVLGLFFASVLLGSLFWQITAFTLAHSITLSLATMSLVKISPSLVEPLIALSIMWVTIENCFFKNISKWRPLLVFCFGLLHGLGFAAVLKEFGLPTTDLISSLLAFNIGVELGQLTIIIMVLLMTFWIQKKHCYRQFVQIPVSIVIGLVGCYWFIERVFY